MKPARAGGSTASERSRNPDITLPASPYGLSLAIRMASSSSSNGMTDQHRAEDLLLGDGHRVVDVDEQRRPHVEALVETGRRPGAADQRSRRPRRCPSGCSPSTRSRCLAEITGPHSVPGSWGSPHVIALVHGLEDLDALVVAGAGQQHPGRVSRSPGRRACTARCRSCRRAESRRHRARWWPTCRPARGTGASWWRRPSP